jgi:hypothetical protein
VLQLVQGGPVTVFNQSGNGADGTNPGNCGGDNCQIGGGNGEHLMQEILQEVQDHLRDHRLKLELEQEVLEAVEVELKYQAFRSSGNSGGNGEIIFRFLQVKQ